MLLRGTIAPPTQHLCEALKLDTQASITNESGTTLHDQSNLEIKVEVLLEMPIAFRFSLGYTTGCTPDIRFSCPYAAALLDLPRLVLVEPRGIAQRDRDVHLRVTLVGAYRARKRGPGADRPTDPSCSKRVTVDREERGRSCRYRGSEA